MYYRLNCIAGGGGTLRFWLDAYRAIAARFSMHPLLARKARFILLFVKEALHYWYLATADAG
jgi:hypothetical protein